MNFERILLADDNLAFLATGKMVLEISGHEVTTAKSIQEIRKYPSKEYDLAIIDGFEGRCFEVYDEINAKRKVILTGNGDVLINAKKRKLEVYSKGLSLNKVLTKIKNAC